MLHERRVDLGGHDGVHDPEVGANWIGNTMVYADRMMRFGQPEGRGVLQTSRHPKVHSLDYRGRHIVGNRTKTKSSSDSLLATAKHIWGAYRSYTPH